MPRNLSVITQVQEKLAFDQSQFAHEVQTSKQYDPISSLQRFNFQWFYSYFSLALPFLYYVVSSSNYPQTGWLKQNLNVVQSLHIIEKIIKDRTVKCDMSKCTRWLVYILFHWQNFIQHLLCSRCCFMCFTSINLILMLTQWGRCNYYHPQWTDEVTEASWSWVTGPLSHS